MIYMRDGEVVDEANADSCRVLILDNEGKRIQEVYGEISQGMWLFWKKVVSSCQKKRKKDII